jgi:transposase IS66 family protein
MDSATEPKQSLAGGEPRQKGSKTSKLSIHEERTVELEAPPQGARFKGYTDYVVQDLMIRPHVVNFHCERWQTADGAMMTAPLPAGISGHFGPQLRRFVLAQYHQAQVTVPRLLALLRGFGIIISKRQIVRLLIAGQEDFLDEARDVLRAGLFSAKWITVDDTGTRHKAANGFCTQIGNAHFAWFGTTGSKNRGNFLDLLRAGHADYVINAKPLEMRSPGCLIGENLIGMLSQAGDHRPGEGALAHIGQCLGILALKVHPDPVMVATEGALWGSIKAHGFLPDTVIVSDDAGQFNVGQHGLCWVHAERLVHTLDTFTDEQREAQASIRELIWSLYRDLKAYRRNPSRQRKAALRARFDRIFARKTGFVTLDRLLARLHGNKRELLMVLDRPEIPLHTNGSENDIRCQVTKRKVSGGTRSDMGRRFSAQSQARQPSEYSRCFVLIRRGAQGA